MKMLRVTLVIVVAALALKAPALVLADHGAQDSSESNSTLVFDIAGCLQQG